jgi:hypothetical protein
MMDKKSFDLFEHFISWNILFFRLRKLVFLFPHVNNIYNRKTSFASRIVRDLFVLFFESSAFFLIKMLDVFVILAVVERDSWKVKVTDAIWILK